MAESSGGVQVVTAEGVKEEIAELTAISADDDSARRAEIEALKECIAELFLQCEKNPYADGAPAQCRWLAVGPRAGLRTHRKAQQRLRSD